VNAAPDCIKQGSAVVFQEVPMVANQHRIECTPAFRQAAAQRAQLKRKMQL
jgi:hypothetical protein